MMTQSELVKFASKRIKELVDVGIEVEKVKIRGSWHSVHKDYVLKAPIPPGPINWKTFVIEPKDNE